MSYATEQDLIDRFGQDEIIKLADRDADGVADSAVVTFALADADSTIDLYLGQRYKLPLKNSYQLLTAVAADIARYSLSDDQPTKQVVSQYRSQIKLLEKMAAGEIRFSGEDDVATPVATAPEHSAGSGEFSDLKGY